MLLLFQEKEEIFIFFVNESMGYCHYNFGGFEKKKKKNGSKKETASSAMCKTKLTMALNDDRDS